MIHLNRRNFLVVILLFIGFPVILLAQTDSSYSIEFSEREFGNKIPSLEALIDSACKNSPILKFQQSSIDINQLQLKIAKIQWIKNISIESSYQYGMFGNILLNSSSEDPLANSVLTTNKQTRYSTGFSVKLPISEIFSRKHEIKIGEESVNQTILEKEKQTEELRKLVIMQYNELMLRQKILVIVSNNLQAQNLQLAMAEKEFLNNKIDLGELGRIKEIQSKSEIEFETAKSAFLTSFQILQEITGVKLKY